MRRLVLTLLLSCSLPAAVCAADAYPNRPIRLIVPYAQGSDTDLLARNLATHIRKYLDQQLIQPDYQPGQSGAKAATQVLHATPDGYTLLAGRINTQVLVPAFEPQTPYRWNQFTNIAVVEIAPLICAVRGDSPHKTVRDLLAAIRKQPGTLKYSTSGTGTALNFSVQYLLHLSGIKPDAVTGIHLDSGAKATAALLNDEVQFICNNALSLIPHIRSGKLRGLFTTAPGRLNALPQLANAREAGLRDMAQIVGGTILVGPPKLPAEVIARWKRALAQLAQDPAWLAEVERLGGLPALRSIPDTEQFIKDQARLYEQLIAKLGLRP